MADRREDILVRLLAILGDLDGFAANAVGRNDPDMTDIDLPTLILFDGDEEVDERNASRTRPANRPFIVNMSPTIRMEINGAEIGTTANEHRAAIIDAVTTDATLLALLKDGEMAYDGAQMALVTNGRELIYQMDVGFTFTYVMQPGTLSGSA